MLRCLKTSSLFPEPEWVKPKRKVWVKKEYPKRPYPVKGVKGCALCLVIRGPNIGRYLILTHALAKSLEERGYVKILKVADTCKELYDEMFGKK